MSFFQQPIPSNSGTSAVPLRSAAPIAPAPPAAPTATEIVTRPDPGLARGKWEAPPWVFWTILALVVVGAGVYALRRFGILSWKKSGKRAPREETPKP